MTAQTAVFTLCFGGPEREDAELLRVAKTVADCANINPDAKWNVVDGVCQRG